MRILQKEAELEEIVRLVGIDALSARDQLTMEIARSIREDYLHQNAFHEVDTFTSIEKQLAMLRTVLAFEEVAVKLLDKGTEMKEILGLSIREEIAKARYIPEDQIAKFDKLLADVKKLTAEDAPALEVM